MAQRRKRRRRTEEELLADLEAQLAAAKARRDGFSAATVARERARLELSAADFGQLIGVSPLTIYNWEKGKSRPRQAQIDKLDAVKGIGKREAWKRLGYG